jgi:carbamoyl-phosphate synthase large subunit
MTAPFTILLTSAGRRVALLRLLRADARALGLEPRILTTDLAPELSAACAEADLAVPAPRATDPAYGAFLSALCAREKVRLLVPTIDPELAPIAAIADALRAAGTAVNISSPASIAIARDKEATMRALHAAGIAVPRSFTPAEAAAWGGAMIAKPRDGSASKGVRVVGPEELATLPAGMLVQEQLAGAEFTVNLFVHQGRTVAAVPHQRLAVRAGEVEKGITRRVPALAEIAARLPAALPGLSGVLCFQAITTDDGPKVFEVNARFGGGFPLAHRAGAPFTRWLIADAAGLAWAPDDDWQDGITMLRFDDAVFTP